MMIDKVITGYLQENCYILTINDCCLVIDPGDNYELIKEKIKTNNVVGILLTHNHFDHIGAVEDIVKDYKISVYSFDNLKEGKFNIKHFNFEVIYTPGHTKDSVTYYFKKEKVMFTGDFLFKGTIGRCDLPTGDINDMNNSLNKIKIYDDDITVYPGHGEKSTIIYEKDNNRYMFTK